MEKKELIGLTASQIEDLLAVVGEPPYRARQLYHALYRQHQYDLKRITPFPARLRERLNEECQATLPGIEKQFNSSDGTVRYLLRLADGAQVETVLMPERARHTICLSTQAGCAVDCKFCLTGLLGLRRNFTPGEITGQALLACQQNGLRAGERLNLVFMGMGEPLLNYESVLAAVRLLADPEGIGMSTSRMTLSTAGVVPGIRSLAQEAVRPRLAISLNATTDAIRDRIMPINRKWPIEELLQACREFPLLPREKLTFEYVLLEGVNDTLEDARRLARITSGFRSKVNLIGWNPGPELPFRSPPQAQILRFQQTLIRKGVSAYIRTPRGRDISAACGQLKLAQGF